MSDLKLELEAGGSIRVRTAHQGTFQVLLAPSNPHDGTAKLNRVELAALRAALGELLDQPKA